VSGVGNEYGAYRNLERGRLRGAGAQVESPTLWVEIRLQNYNENKIRLISSSSSLRGVTKLQPTCAVVTISLFVFGSAFVILIR
jgi:hypothetical protein